MKVSVGRDSENSLKIVTVPLKSGLLATMVSLRGHGSFVRLSSFSLQALLLVSIKDKNEH